MAGLSVLFPGHLLLYLGADPLEHVHLLFCDTGPADEVLHSDSNIFYQVPVASRHVFKQFQHAEHSFVQDREFPVGLKAFNQG